MTQQEFLREAPFKTIPGGISTEVVFRVHYSDGEHWIQEYDPIYKCWKQHARLVESHPEYFIVEKPILNMACKVTFMLSVLKLHEQELDLTHK